MIAFNDIADLIDIPPDGTLSRVLHKDERIRLVAFGFDTDQELTEHSSASAVVVQVVTGRIRFDVGEASSELTPVSWIYLEPNEPHSLRALEPSVVLLTLIRT